MIAFVFVANGFLYLGDFYYMHQHLKTWTWPCLGWKCYYRFCLKDWRNSNVISTFYFMSLIFILCCLTLGLQHSRRILQLFDLGLCHFLRLIQKWKPLHCIANHLLRPEAEIFPKWGYRQLRMQIGYFPYFECRKVIFIHWDVGTHTVSVCREYWLYLSGDKVIMSQYIKSVLRHKIISISTSMSLKNLNSWVLA